MAAPANVSVLRHAFVDICRGYSVALYKGQPLYIRHLSHFEHWEYDSLQSRFEQEARAQGAKGETEKLAELKRNGLWSDQKENDIARQKDTITRFEDTIRTTPQPSIVASLSQQVEGERIKLAGMLTERAETLGTTAEVYAQRLINDYYVVTNLFADKDLRVPMFDAKVFDEMGESEVEQILKVYHAAIAPCEDEGLRQLAVQEFFTAYYGLSGDRPEAFYGRPISQMTYYQIRLMNIARYFRAIMEQTDLSKLPPGSRSDPDAVERLYTAQKNAKAMQEEGKLPGQMTQSDIEQTGLKGQYAQVTKPESAVEMVQRLRRSHNPAG